MKNTNIKTVNPWVSIRLQTILPIKTPVAKTPLLGILLLLCPMLVYAQCTIGCNDNLNIFLEANGTRTITPEMVRNGASTITDCTDFTVIPGTITCEDVGKENFTYLLTWKDENGDDQNCWGFLNVVDNMAPEFTHCPTDLTIPCFADSSPEAIAALVGAVTVEDNCGSVSPTHEDFLNDNGDCADDVITRTWSATDASGNPALACVQMITLEVPTIIDITWPESPLTIGNSSIEYDLNGLPAPSVTGEPIYQSCGQLALNYEDIVTSPPNAAILKFDRNWTILDFCHPDADYTFTQEVTVSANPNRFACNSDTDDCFDNVQDAVDNAKDGEILLISGYSDLGDIIMNNKELNIVIAGAPLYDPPQLAEIRVVNGALSIEYTDPGSLKASQISMMGDASITFLEGNYDVEIGNGAQEGIVLSGEGAPGIQNVLTFENNGAVNVDGPIVVAGVAEIVAAGRGPITVVGEVQNVNDLPEDALENGDFVIISSGGEQSSGPSAIILNGGVDLTNLNIQINEGALVKFNGDIINGGPQNFVGLISSESTAAVEPGKIIPFGSLPEGEDPIYIPVGILADENAAAVELGIVDQATLEVFFEEELFEGFGSYNYLPYAVDVSLLNEQGEEVATTFSLTLGYAQGAINTALPDGPKSTFLVNDHDGIAIFYATTEEKNVTIENGTKVSSPGNKLITAMGINQASPFYTIECEECEDGLVRICTPNGEVCVTQQEATDLLNNGSYCGACQVSEGLPTFPWELLWVLGGLILTAGVIGLWKRF